MSTVRQAPPLCRPVEPASGRRLRAGVEEFAIDVRGALGERAVRLVPPTAVYPKWGCGDLRRTA
jgi:hypothetical protein